MSLRRNSSGTLLNTYVLSPSNTHNYRVSQEYQQSKLNKPPSSGSYKYKMSDTDDRKMAGDYSLSDTAAPDHGRSAHNYTTRTPSAPIVSPRSSACTPRYLVGLVFLAFVVIIWVGSSWLMKFIYSSGETSFNKPFFLSYYNASMFSVYLLGFVWRPQWRANWPTREEFKAYWRSEAGADHLGDRSPLLPEDPDNRETKPVQVADVPMSTMEVFHAAAVFSVLWFLGNYAFNLALSLTSVSSVTIISSTSGFWTMLLEHMLLRTDDKRFSLVKIVFIIMSIGGVVMVTMSDAQHSADDPSAAPEPTNENNGLEWVAVGDMIALLSAALYGVYLVFLERRIKSDKRLDMTMFFGFVGVCSAFLLWPWFFILHFTGLEVFTWPAASTWGYLTLNALIGTVLSDYLWLYATLLTTPVVSTLALSLTIPLALVVDSFTKSIVMDGMFIWGSVLVLVAFVGMNMASDMTLVKHAFLGLEKVVGRKMAKVLTGHRSEA